MLASTLGGAAITAGTAAAAVTAVTGDALVAVIGGVISAAFVFAGVIVATRPKRTEPAAPPVKAADVVTIPRRRYDELLRAEERHRLHADEQSELRRLRKDRGP